MKTVLNAQKCPYEAYLASIGLVSENGEDKDLAITVKEYMTSHSLQELKDIKFNEANLVPELDKINFTLEKEQEIIKNRLLNNITYLGDYFYKNNIKIIETNKNIKTTINKKDLFLKIDWIVQANNGDYFAFTVHSSKGTYKVAEKNYGDSLEFYIMQELVSTLDKQYPGIRPGKIHLKADTTGDIMILPTIDKISQKAKWNKALLDAIAIPINKNSSKEGCNSWGHCNKCPYKNLCEFFKTNTEELVKVKKEKAVAKGIIGPTKTQETLINSDKGICVVSAGAGTGKTFTLANKCVAMVQDGIPASEILVITFTEKGIQEIKERINFWLTEWFITEITADDFPIYTFNAYGDVVLKENYQRFGFTAEPKLIDSVDKYELIKEILDKFPKVDGLRYDNPLLKMYNAKGAIFEFEDIILGLKKVAEDPVRLSEYIDNLKNKYGNSYDNLKDMIDYYNKYLMDNNLIEYEDQTNALVKICQIGYEDLFKKYYKKDIICDEFQDTDEKQLLFIRACANKPDFHSLTMVGDDSQSIFGWRGANVEIFLNLKNYFNNLKEIKMVENFRSTSEITDLANKINALDNNGIKKDLVSPKPGKKPELTDSSKEGTTVTMVNKIKELIKNGENLYDIGVIARTKQELQEINIKLQEAKIPCLVSVHEFLVDNPKVKNILGLPKFLLDTEKNLYLAEFLQAKEPEVFESQTDIGNYVAKEAKRIIEELEELKANSEDYNKDLVDYFFKMLDELDNNDKALVKFREILTSKTFSSLEDIEVFLSKLKAYDADFGIEKDEEAYDAITLMTPHSAKGREFKIILASLDNFEYGGKSKEDNRCLFVTVTRAMEELYLYQDLSIKSSKQRYYPLIEEFLK